MITYSRKLIAGLIFFICISWNLVADNLPIQQQYPQLSITALQNVQYELLEDSENYFIVIIDGITYYVEK